MGQIDTVLSALYAVINLMISVIIGFILSKLGVLTPKTRSVVSSVNYYALVPIYGLIYIMQAIDRNSLKEFGIILFSSISTVFVGFIVTLIGIWLLGPDIRYKFAFVFVIVYQNIVVMPQMLADSLCGKGGKYETTNTCKKALVKPYCSLTFVYVNIVYWVSVLPVLQNEKTKSNIIRRAYLTALNYYESVEKFLQDTDFVEAKSPDFDKKELERMIAKANGKELPPVQVTTTAATGAVPSKDASPLAGQDPRNAMLETNSVLIKEERKPCLPATSEHPKFIEEFFGKRLTYDDYVMTEKRLEEFNQKVLSRKEEEANKKAIEEAVLYPENLMDKPVIDDILSWDFYYRRVIKSPPAIMSIVGLILGFIFPFKEWFFDPNTKPLPTFIATLQTVGGMMSPISLFLLGTYIAQSSAVSADLYIRWKHIICANVIRNLVMPLLGLLWTYVFIKGMDRDIYDHNPVLLFIQYCYWIVPNGIILIAVYVVADYFAKEFAVLSIYMNLISIPMMAIYMIIYFVIYES